MPSIRFIQSTNGSFTIAAGDTITLGPITITAGSLLVLNLGSYINGGWPASVTGASVSDDKANTWRPFGYCDDYPYATALQSRTFYAANCAAGATTITATFSSGSFHAAAATVAEFAVPSTLTSFAAEGAAVIYPGGTFTYLTPTLTLPTDGLMVAAFVFSSAQTALTNTGFTNLATISDVNTFVYEGFAYAIGPQRAQQHGFTTGVGGGAGLSLVSFLDTAGFAARPKPVGGKGASW